MVQPTYFDVKYVINPWMQDNINAVDKVLAMQQWNNLVATLNVVGAITVVLPPPPSNCPDAVFVANAGLIVEQEFFPSLFKYKDRAAEEPYFAEYFQFLNFELIHLDNGVAFEGAGDALFSADGTFLFLGNGLRTDKLAYNNISAEVKQVIQLDLIDPNFYHLDTCFCPLDTGYLLWNPRAFSKESVDKICEIYTPNKRICVGYEDANSFGCNAISVGKSIILPLVSQELQDILIDKGHYVYCVDMSEFLKAGGGPKCCTLS